MKQIFIIILSLLAFSITGHSQPPELFTRTWKVERLIAVLGADTTTTFHKDSTNNAINLSSLQYHFFHNGTYTITSDTSSSQGTWALNATSDSAIIDTVPFRMTELSSTHFTTRGYSLEIVDASNTIDTSFSYVTLYPVVPLPVNLLSFTGRYADNLVTLNWSTAQEHQNKEFQVQYSTDGHSFTTIDTVPGKINSNTMSNYLFNTARYHDGNNFYRLKQVDMDGNSAFSSILNIVVSQQTVIILSPNPTATTLNLSMSQPVSGMLRLTLTTLAGQQVWSAMIAGNTNNATVHLPSLVNGVYIATITNGNGEKLLISKLLIQQ